MATTGWLGEQTVHEWGGWGTRFTTNVYISGIRRYSDHVDVSGTIYLYCKSNGAYSVWYDWNITSWSMGNNLGQIKERTYTNNILNRSWGKNFTVRINCSNSATSATFNAGFSDSNMGGRDKYWTIYFDRYATAPSGITSTSSYTEYSTITTSCSGIKWGQGYSNRKLTCTASYTFNGKTENFNLGTWTDGATSKTVTKSDFNFPADLNVSIKWVASTNVGSTTATTQVRVGQTYPAPNLSEVSFEGNSPSTYKLNATVTGINYGENYSKREANLYFDYTLDGISYSTLLSSISDGSTSITVEYDSTAESEPWKFIPDDEKGILRLVVDNGHRTSTKSSAQIYCQPQYEAYIVESIPDSEKEKSEIYTGKNIQIQNAPKDAPLADFKLYGDTFQQSYMGKNLFDPSATPTVIGHQTFKKSETGFTATVALDNKTETWSEYIEFVFELKPNTTYSISKKSKVVSGTSYRFAGALRFHDLDTSSYGAAQNADSITFTTGSVGKAGILFYTSYLDPTKGNVSSSIEFFDVQLEESASATPFEPYVGGEQSPNPDYPQPIQAVTGLQTVDIHGKNLLDFQRHSSSWNGASVVVEGTSITFTADKSGVAGMSFSTPTEPISIARGNTIVFSRTWLNGNVWESGNFYFNLVLYYSDGTSERMHISATTTSNYKSEKSVSKTIEKDVVSIALSGSSYEVKGQLEPITFGIQLELGSTASSFVPCSKQTYTIDLGDIELCKLGEYQDYIWKDGEDWKIHKATAKSIFKDIEWHTSRISNTDHYRQESISIKTEVLIPTSNTKFIGACSRYTVVTAGDTYAYPQKTGVAIQFSGYSTSGNICVYDLLYDAPNQSDNFKAARANTEIYYALATPTDKTITDQTLIEQLEAIRKASLQKGENNIMNIAIAPNLAGDMEISYYTKWQDTFPATLYSNGKNGTGQFKQIRRIGTK